MSNIVITGANQGIGYYFVEQALKNGNKVAVLDIKTDNLESLEQSFSDKLFYYKADVCDISSKRFIICHSFVQKIQTIVCYLFPLKMGKLMSKMASRYVINEQSNDAN